MEHLMVDYSDRAYQIFTDPDSTEIGDAAYWLVVRLNDREHREHGQAVEVLRRLLEWAESDPRQEDSDAQWNSDMAAMRDEAEYFARGY